MLLLDVNIYVYAHREDSPHHRTIKSFVENRLAEDEPVGHSPLALSGFLRVITHPKIFNPPSELELGLEFLRPFTDSPGCIPVSPGKAHWSIFTHLIRAAGAKGNLIPDAWFAALAIEHGCTWVTTDHDYSRFPGLKIIYPLTA